MANRGIPARDLRPFSIEDPFGLGVVSPSQQKIRDRFHRREKKPRAKTHEAQVRRAAPTPRRVTAPAPPVRPPTPRVVTTQATKPKFFGCLTTLVVLGVLYAVGTFAIPFVWNIIRQEIVLQTGQSGFGRILRAEATNGKINEDTIYEMSVEVHIAGTPPFTVELEQALPVQQVRHLEPGAWAELRYDPSDPTSIVLVSVGIPDPRTSTQSPALDLQAIPEEASNEEVDTDEVIADQVVPAERPVLPAEDPGAAARSPSGKAAPEPKAQEADPAPLQPKTIEKPAPADAVEPQPLPAPAAPSLICRQASACCKIAGGGACSSFSSPGVDSKACRRALRGFTQLAEAAGKSCSGLAQ